MPFAKGWISVALLPICVPICAQAQGAAVFTATSQEGSHEPAPAPASAPASALAARAAEAQRQLRQTFTNLQFEDFGPSPIEGPIYQAMAGGRLLYFAPQSEHLLFAAVYDRAGLNITALTEEAGTRRKLAKIDTSQALAIGPPGAPTVIEFTDPDCPHCRALDRFWGIKMAEGKPVRRLIFFVTGMHPDAAAKAEHILCSPDREAAFKAIYDGAAPTPLTQCPQGRLAVDAHAQIVRQVGIGGTPTLVAAGQIIAGFRQAEIETFLETSRPKGLVKDSVDASH